MTKETDYEHYRNIKSWDEYFTEWNSYEDNSEDTEKAIKNEIYRLYVVRCKTFQRANFKCQNLNCETPKSPLTIHHIKFQKNGGEWKFRNCIILCKKCQLLLHGVKDIILLPNDDSVPAHVRGLPLQLDSTKNIEWKKTRIKALEIQKNCKHIRNIPVSWETISLLLKWLFKHYEDIQEEHNKGGMV